MAHNRDSRHPGNLAATNGSYAWRAIVIPIVSSAKKSGRQILKTLRLGARRTPPSDSSIERAYLDGGKIPWSPGYEAHKHAFISRIISDSTWLECFRSDSRLPTGYGVGLDERCIELPWVLSHLANERNVLDAGSALNHGFLLDSSILRERKLSIVTLFPESDCFWDRGVSYVFDDLRHLPFRDDLFDAVVCISTLEHIGCDNSIYTSNLQYREQATEDYIVAIKELYRVLKPGACCLLTVPYGIYQHLGWSQQFNSTMLSQAITGFGGTGNETKITFYRYSSSGWQVVSPDECADCEYVGWIADAWLRGTWPDVVPVEPDLAAAARAVACVRLLKDL